MMTENRVPRRLVAGLVLFFLVTILFVERVRSQPDGVVLNLELETFVAAGQLDQPVDVANAGDERLFVVEKGGRIRVVANSGAVAPVPFLDISGRVLSDGGEQGLLGLVFHPDYEENGYFYVNYTAVPDGETHISRFRADPGSNVADPGSEALLLAVAQPHANHNAGDLAFGPDGYLYIPLGDGGGSYDPQNRAQNQGLLLGKILRVDVDGAAGLDADCGEPGDYTVPGDNPFVDGPGNACDEVWALGLRNPWRLSFDRQSGDLYIGDVGQNSWEEIDFQPGDSAGGENYGWDCYEGAHETPEQFGTGCDAAGAYEMPVFEYAHFESGCSSVSGGYVYRGWMYPQMMGRYFLVDFCQGVLWDLDVAESWAATRHDGLQSSLAGVASFGQDIDGELYLANMFDGAVYRLAEDTAITDLVNKNYLPLVGG